MRCSTREAVPTLGRLTLTCTAAWHVRTSTADELDADGGAAAAGCAGARGVAYCSWSTASGSPAI